MLLLKARFHFTLSGCRHIRNLSQTCSELEFGLSSSTSKQVCDRPATSLGHVCNQGSVMECGFEPVCDQLRTCLRPDSVMEFGLKEVAVIPSKLMVRSVICEVTMTEKWMRHILIPKPKSLTSGQRQDLHRQDQDQGHRNNPRDASRPKTSYRERISVEFSL